MRLAEEGDGIGEGECGEAFERDMPQVGEEAGGVDDEGGFVRLPAQGDGCEVGAGIHASLTIPIGPFLCFAIITSVSPTLSLVLS